MFDNKSQQKLLIAVLQDQKNSGDEHPARHDREKLKRKAMEARQQFKYATKIASKFALGHLSESELSCQPIELLKNLDAGLL